MGSAERADGLVIGIPDRLLREAARVAYLRCGNCRHRILCATDGRLIDLGRAAGYMLEEGMRPRGHARTSLAARTGARLIANCLRCDRADRCAGYYLAAVGRERDALALLVMLRWKLRFEGEPSIELLLADVLRDQRLPTWRIAWRLMGMWRRCERCKGGRTFANAVTVGEIRS